MFIDNENLYLSWSFAYQVGKHQLILTFDVFVL